MDAPRLFAARCRGMAVLPHIKKLEDALKSLPRASHPSAGRIAGPEVLARLCESSATLEAVGKRRRCSKCGTQGAEVVASPFRASGPRIHRGRLNVGSYRTNFRTSVLQFHGPLADVAQGLL